MSSSCSYRKSYRSFRRTLAVLAALSCAGLFSAPARALTIPGSMTMNGKLVPCGYIQNHIYLNEPSGPVDVTNTEYTQNGQTYVVYNGNSIPVIINNSNGNVYDLNYNIIGFVYLAASQPK